MKTLAFLILAFFVSVQMIAQENVNVKKGYAVHGYDVTEYFNNKAVKGDKAFVANYEGVKYLFANADNLAKFNEAPDKYVPEYGGYCAYAIAKNGKKYDIDPETYEIRDGKLYLFYNKWGNNTLEKWLEEEPDTLKAQADAAWSRI